MIKVSIDGETIFTWNMGDQFLSTQQIVALRDTNLEIYADGRELEHLITFELPFDPHETSYTYQGPRAFLILGYLCGSFS